MPGISVDQLTLELPFMPESQARRLAMGIADGLAVAGLSWGAGEVSALRIDLSTASAQDPKRLVEQVVAEIARQLYRTP
jgi:hypothetical protein